MARYQIRPPIVDAHGLPSGDAHRLVDDANQEIRARYANITGDADLDDDQAVISLTELECYAARVSAEALRLELAHVYGLLEELYSANGARVVHVRRDDLGNIIQLVGIDGSAA
jgi:hypothetical protein